MVMYGGHASYTASSERHSILVSLIRVQHTQVDGQLPLVIRDDGVGQRAFSVTANCHHILFRREGHIYFVNVWTCYPVTQSLYSNKHHHRSSGLMSNFLIFNLFFLMGHKQWFSGEAL